MANSPVDHVGEPGKTRLVMPEGMSIEAAKVWMSTVATLRRMKLSYNSDVTSLRCYCEAVVLHKRASEALQHDSLLTKDGTKNPLVQVQRDAAEQVRVFAREFGLTPAARGLLNKDKPVKKKDDPPTVVDAPVVAAVPTLDEIAKRRNVRKFGA